MTHWNHPDGPLDYIEAGTGAPDPEPCQCGSLICDWCGDEDHAPHHWNAREHEETP